MARVNEYSTNLGLTLLPEVDQVKEPQTWAELLRIRNAFTGLQRALDTYTGALSEDPQYWNQTQPASSIRIQNITRYYAETSVTITLGQLINIWDDAGQNKVQLADATSGTTLPAMGFCTQQTVNPGEFGEFMLLGAMPYFTGLVSGQLLYLDTTAGQITNTPPAGSGDLVQQIGFVISPTTIWFNPAGTWAINP